MAMDYSTLPGSDLVRGGIKDLRAGIESPQAFLFSEIEPLLYRYPALHPPAFRQAVEEALADPPQE